MTLKYYFSKLKYYTSIQKDIFMKKLFISALESKEYSQDAKKYINNNCYSCFSNYRKLRDLYFSNLNNHKWYLLVKKFNFNDQEIINFEKILDAH